jgi:hypothetical protein
MHDKDTTNAAQLIEWLQQFAPYFTTIFLSIWGGVVNHIQTIRATKKKFKWSELAFDLVTSTFAGLLTFYLCRSAGINETTSAVLIAVSGHMGTRAIAGFENLYRRVMGIKQNEEA